ncbi:MAG TPA: AAA family ATPase [Spirochaetota bacterium]|nr:AAA family ATPase [Spirochaetota bacterium]
MREYSIPGILRPIALDMIDGRRSIIMEGFEGCTLSDYVRVHLPGILELTGIFIRVSGILGELHDRKIIHRDVKPRNIMIDEDGGEIRLIDFSSSTMLKKEMQVLCSPRNIEGQLEYMSPEQTGRMNRSVDYRSDYYSLGVTMYELFTGRLPFNSDDPMELVHSHIARKPIPPHKINSSVPAPLSEIILKLMAKRAEDRYQTVRGLLHDLELAEKILRRGEQAAGFSAGSCDRTSQFRISEKLYGRENEISKLYSAFKKAAAGSVRVLIVTGDPGIGKSFLINEIHRPLVEKKGIFISGKYDSMKRNIPYYAFIAAFRDLVRQILTESDSEIESWKKSILSSLGGNGRLLLDVIPELELIIGSQPEPEPTGPVESKNRFNRVLIDFMSIFADRKHPLVLFLDDLQWIDTDSLNLLEAIMDEAGLGHFLLIGACRKDDADLPGLLHVLFDLLRRKLSMVEFIEIGPLEFTEICRLVADTLGLESERSEDLARIVLQKTGGNPFFTREFLITLESEYLIFFDDGWRYDREKIQGADLSDNLADHMTRRILNLPDDLMRLLKFGACIGGSFDPELVSRITGHAGKDIFNDLAEIVNQGIIIKTGNLYKFTHDKIKAAVYAQIAERDRELIHHMIGMTLLRSGGVNDSNIFVIAHHLNASSGITALASEKVDLSLINYNAGMRAKRAAAFEAAYLYFIKGIESLPPRSWETNYDLTLRLNIECGEAGYLNGRPAEAETYFKQVMSESSNVLDRIRIYEVRIAWQVMQFHPEESIRIGIEALGLLGISMPAGASVPRVLAEMLKVGFYQAFTKIERTADQASMTDPEKLAIMRLLMSIAEPCYLADPAYLPVVICRMIVLTLRRGVSQFSSFAFAAYGLLLCGIFNRFSKGYIFGKTALDLIQRYPDSPLRARVLYLYGNMISLWKRHIRESYPYLLESFRRGRDAGDYSYSAYAINNYNIISLFAGEPIDDIVASYSRYYTMIKSYSLPAMTSGYELFWQAMIALGSPDFCQGRIAGEIASEDVTVPEFVKNGNANPLEYYYLLKMMLLYLSGDYGGAMNSALEGKKYLDSVAGTILVPEYYYYLSLIAHDFYFAGGIGKGACLKILWKTVRRFRRWSLDSPMNFGHMLHLVRAMHLNVLRGPAAAEEDCMKAVSAAHNGGFTQDYAFACELAGALFSVRGNVTKSMEMVFNARDAYQKWGAIGKLSQLESKYPGFFTKSAADGEHAVQDLNMHSLFESMDLMTLIRANQAISMEIVLEKLVEKLLNIVIQNSGSDRAVLLLMKDEVLMVLAECGAAPGDFRLHSLEADKYGNIPGSVVNYVKRTSQEVVINRIGENPLFSGDEYFKGRERLSVLCIPLIRQKSFRGMIYLENGISEDVFMRERIELVRIIATQAAISLENAILFDKARQAEMDMEQQYEEIQAQYEEMETLHEDLEETFHELSETNRKLEKEKEQLGTMLRSIAEGIIATDQTGRIILINARAEDLLGVRQNAVLGKMAGMVVAVYDGTANARFDDPVAVALRSGSPVEIKSDAYLKSAEGVKTNVSVSCAPVKNAAGFVTGVVMVIQDLTDRKKMEEEMIKSSKIESLGIFAGGIAHDFNNILTSIIGNLSLLKTQAKRSGAESEIISEIEKSSVRAKDLTHQLLTFSKGGAPIKKVTSITNLIRETAEFVLSGSGIKCHFLFGDKLWNIEADEGQISQVIQNLVINARQAMDNSGQIWIRAQNYSPVRADHGFLSGDYIRITVRDQGTGIPPEIIHRIFDPYFTTKEKGNGLGLAISYSIIKKHGGHVRVESDGKHGTTVEVFLPSTTKEVPPDSKETDDLVLAGGRLLLMDDDEMVLKVGVRMFEKLGFEVDVARKGEEAVDMYLKAMNDKNPYVAVVMDLTVPGGMGGREAISILRKADPGVKAIVSSGYSNDPVMAHFGEFGFDGIIVKPYRIRELKMALYAVLKSAT